MPEKYHPALVIISNSGERRMVMRKLLTTKEKLKSFFTGIKYAKPSLVGYPISQRITQRQDHPEAMVPEARWQDRRFHACRGVHQQILPGLLQHNTQWYRSRTLLPGYSAARGFPRWQAEHPVRRPPGKAKRAQVSSRGIPPPERAVSWNPSHRGRAGGEPSGGELREASL